MNELNFDLDVVEVPVQIGDQHFLLREASGEAGKKYTNAQTRGMRVEDGKVIGFGDMAEADHVLLSSCLFRVEDGKPTEKRVGVDTIAKWKNKIVKALVEKCKEISDLDIGEMTIDQLKAERAKIDAKIQKLDSLGNGRASTPDGSE